jgi:hypothetical protein
MAHFDNSDPFDQERNGDHSNNAGDLTERNDIGTEHGRDTPTSLPVPTSADTPDIPSHSVETKSSTRSDNGNINSTECGVTQPGRDTTPSGPPSPNDTLEGIASHHTLKAHSSTRTDHSDTDDHQNGHHHTLDKLASAFDNVQSGVKERARIAKQKFHLESIHATSVSQTRR